MSLFGGNNRAYIFKSKDNKEEYKKIVSKYKKRYRFKLYAYCLMDNHAHLLIEVANISLSKIMQGIQQVFTQITIEEIEVPARYSNKGINPIYVIEMSIYYR